MITIKNIQTIDRDKTTLTIASDTEQTIDGARLLALPGLIDPHVHFRTPGHEHKENWVSAAKAAIAGGYTTVFDMPNNLPACVSAKRLAAKKALIEQQLIEAKVPLRYQLYLGADCHHFDQIALCKDEIIGLKIFMGSSTGDLLMDDDSSLHAAFAIAAKHNLMVAVHAEDECDIQERTKKFAGETDFCVHSKIRTPELAAKAVKLAIDLARMYGAKLYVLHVSTVQELDLIIAAKKEGLPVYAETTPHHLFLNTDAYAQLGAKAQMNPPLRERSQQSVLFNAIKNGYIDTIGSDHAPHTLAEKDQPYGKAPSGVPGIETTLPLLLNAYHQGHLTLKQIAVLTCLNPRKMFDYPANDDLVLIDLNLEKAVQESDLKTKCGWSPFAGQMLKGWPVCTILRGQVFWH